MINTKIHFEHENKESKIKVLFVLKERSAYGVSYGLINSCKFISEDLKLLNIECRIATVIDGHDIDRVVSHYRPTHVFIEAIWCPAEKFPILLKLHPKVKWNVRLHSNLPFLAQENGAVEKLNQYNNIVKSNPHRFSISGNNLKLIKELGAIGFNLDFLPNTYTLNNIQLDTKPVGEILNIGCFSALRLLKNIPEQAVVAINVANNMNKKLKFHINSNIHEKSADGVLNNLISIFSRTKHELIFHEWKNLSDFIHLIKRMDVGMQVSMSETWNLVASDFISCGIPIIGSKEIQFLAPQYQANPTDFNDIAEKLKFAIDNKEKGFHIINEILLKNMVYNSVEVWLKYLHYY